MTVDDFDKHTNSHENETYLFTIYSRMEKKSIRSHTIYGL